MKCNHEEVISVARLLGSLDEGLYASAQWLLHAYPLKLLCVTRGEHGSILFGGSQNHAHPGYRVEVVDTVGAGDAFTAGLLHHYLRGSSLDTMNEAANQLGACAFGQRDKWLELPTSGSKLNSDLLSR